MLGREGQQDEKQLECDLDQLMKDVRQSEEYFQNITHYIIKIINSHQSQNCIYVNQDISQYRTIIHKIQKSNKSYSQEYSVTLERYMQAKPLSQNSMILMKRVTYRILEIIFNSIGSISNRIPQIFQEYLRLKINCQKLMQDNTSNKPYPIFKYITDYQFTKINKYLQLFGQLTNHLENGNLDRFNQIEINQFLENYSATQVKMTQTAKNTFFSTLKINKIRVKQKLTSTKPEIRTIQYNPFVHKGRRIFDSLKDVMQLNRQQLIQTYTSYNQRNKQTLFKELINRNKANHQAIHLFHHKKKRIQNVIRTRPLKTDKFEQTQSFQANQDSQSSLECRPINTTRRSLLVKLKANQNHIKLLPSELFRKTSKIQYENRVKVKSYHMQKNQQKVDTNVLLKQVVDDHAKDMMELVKGQNLETIEQKLPFLNKRAQSVDQNYKMQPEAQSNQTRTLSNSLKINQELKLKPKLQKESHPLKAKLQLKAINILASLQVNKKSIRLGEMSKCLYF